MYQPHLLTDAAVESLAAAVVRILDEVPVLCQNAQLLAALRHAGARVDDAAQTVTFPPGVTNGLIAELQRRPLPKLGDGAFPAQGLPMLSGQVAQLVLDYRTGDRRQATTADFLWFTKLGEQLHGADGVGHHLLLTDVPPLVEPLEAAVLLAEYATRPHAVFAWNVRQVPYLQEMGGILGLGDWFSLGAICIAHPFRFDRAVIDRFVYRVTHGGGAGLTAMPVAGMTTPISPAGFAAVAGAEMVAAWLCGRALNPDCELNGSMWGGAVDLRTGTVSYCSFDAMYYSFTVCELLRRWAHVEIPVGGGEYSDAAAPGYMAAWEKAYKAMTIAAFTGRHPGLGQGMLEDGKTLCAAQLMLERELAGGIGLYQRTMEVNDTLLDLAAIREVGHG
ncbi:MAG: trimethylamine methyltransferase family protein, partial [Armatimonadetes bacterium]|nr:trimethylamine methyltransferase family protein [Armatimonadota bacterium]